MKRWQTALLALAIAIAAIGPAAANDQLTLAAPTKGVSLAPILLAVDSGAMRKHGIDLTIAFLTGGPPVIAALLAGDVQFMTVADDALLELVNTNKIICIYAYDNSYTQDLLVRESVLAARKVTRDLPWEERVRRLKGMTMGVLALGGTADQAGRRLWTAAGLDFSNDMTVVRVGALPSQVAGLKQGTIDGFIASSPAREIVEGQKIGQAIIRFDDVAEWADEPYEGIEARGDYLATHREIAERLIAAIVDAQHMILSDPKGAAAILAKGSMSETDETLLEASLMNTRNSFRIEKMSAARWQNVISSRASIDPRIANMQLKEGDQWTNEFYPQ